MDKNGMLKLSIVLFLVLISEIILYFEYDLSPVFIIIVGILLIVSIILHFYFKKKIEEDDFFKDL